MTLQTKEYNKHYTEQIKIVKMYVGSRQSGKTIELIKRSCLYGQTIVVETSVSVRYIKQKAKELGLDIPAPITYDEFINNK